MPLLNLAVFWGLYYAVHSLLIADRIKDYLLKKLRISETTYRLFYVVFSSVTLIFILFYQATITHQYLWHNDISKFFGLMLATYALFILREAFKKYHAKAFLGLVNPEIQSEKLIIEGLQKYIRHPLYAGTLLLFMGFFLFMPTVENLVVLIITILYIFIGIYLEEKKLIKTFGKEYLEYKSKVPMLVPDFKKKFK